MSKQASSKSSATPLVLAGVAWAVVALLFFLLFSAPDASGEQPGWFLVGINLLETGAFAAASILCFRNWRSSQIVSGRNVWFWIGVGLLCYTLGNVMFFLWGTIWGLDPAVSLGDFFYIFSYIFLAAGMFKAVLPRRLNLEPPQWLIIAGVGIAGVLVAYVVNFRVAADLALPTPAAVEVASIAPVQLVQAAPEPTNAPPVELPDVTADQVVPPAGSNAPSWVLSLDEALQPMESVVGLLYLIGDCVLLIIAVTLLVAFWGGRYSQSWKLIAIAAFSLYIADMFFAYALNRGNYIEGSLWEVFWTFSAVFFGLGAVVEHAVSTQSRRSVRRRRG